jgi:stearoyl-CoA desaturase (delta-9 desaturase)
MKTFQSEPKWRNVNIKMVTYLGTMHVLALIALRALPSTKWYTLVFSVGLYLFSILGITAGVHRLWSHRSYRAGICLRIFLMLACSCANQGSILHWVRDHRVHHKFSETSADPHNAKRGFFFAHMGWLLVRKNAEVIAAGAKLKLDDLHADPIVMHQHQRRVLFPLICCFLLPTCLPNLLWNESLYNAYLVAGVLRYVVVLHVTWLVNSWAHLQGSRPYMPNINPAENRWVAFLTQGEGWHNWHHAFPFDYSTSELGISQQWNPTKLFIDMCCALGLANNRKRALNMWNKHCRSSNRPEHLRGIAPFLQRE